MSSARNIKSFKDINRLHADVGATAAPAPKEPVFVTPSVIPTHYKIWGCEGRGQTHRVLWEGKTLSGSDYRKALQVASRLYHWHISGYNDQGLSKIISKESELLKAA